MLKQSRKQKLKKILVVCHNGTIMDLLELIFNIGWFGSRNIGNFKYGTNCHISYINYDNEFKLITGPSTLHFGIYNKNYTKQPI